MMEQELNITNFAELGDYLTEKIAIVEKCYQDLVKPYQTEYGINTSLMSKKEKEEFINKRNCLLVQKHCYKEVLDKIKLED